MSDLSLAPITLRAANDFVEAHHRHNGRTSRDGGKWAVSVVSGGELVGVAIVGRPVARLLDEGWSAEVLRVCTPGIPTEVIDDQGRAHASPVCSMLYASCWRCWKAMGGRRLVTYTLQSENGASLRAAGFRIAAECKPTSWDGPDRGRPRRDQEVYREPKFRWEVVTSDSLTEPNPARTYRPQASENLGLLAGYVEDEDAVD